MNCSFVCLSAHLKKTSFCASMAESDRSRSPVPGRNRAEPRAPVPPVRQELPFFPRWCGPMQTAVWHSQQMSRPQSRPQFRPQFNIQQSGAYLLNQSTGQTLCHPAGHMAQSTLPTSTSIVTSTYSGIFNSTSLDYSTLLTYHAVSTDSSCLTQHSIDPFVPTSSCRHSTYDITRRSYDI